MADNGDSSKSKQIKTLVGVLGAGLATGIFIALVMLYYYNPDGSYPAKNILLDADNAYKIRFIESGSKSKSDVRYSFEGMYFSFYEQSTKQTKSISVSKEKYDIFFKSIAKDISLIDPNEEILKLFNQSNLVKLLLKVHSIGEDSSKGMTTIFSEIDFVDQRDYYRIQLRQSGPGSGWAYFYHPGIYQEIFKLFNPTL